MAGASSEAGDRAEGPDPVDYRGEAPAALGPLLDVLDDHLGLGIEPALRAAVVRDATLQPARGDRPLWSRWLELALPGIGLRIRWFLGTPADLLPLARPDLPVIGFQPFQPGGQQGVFLYVDGGGRRLRVQRVPEGAASFWCSPQTLGGEAQLWALVEPAHPATAFFAVARGAEPVARLWQLLRAEGRDVGVVLVYAVAVGLLGLATPLAIQVLINWLAFGALAQPILVLAGVLLVTLTLAGVLRSLQRLTVELLQRRLFVHLTADLAHRLVRVQLKAFDKAYGPELVNRFFDVLTVQKSVSSLLLDGLAAALQALVGMALLAFYHPVLLAFDLVLVLSIGAILVGLGRGATYTAVKESKAKYAVAAWLEEIARAPTVFKLGGEGQALIRAERHARDYLTYREAHWKVYFRQFIGSQVVTVIASAALLLICGWLVLEGQLTVGQLVAAEFVVTTVLAGFAKFTEKVDSFYDLLAAVDKLGTLVDLPMEPSGGRGHRFGQGGVRLTARGLTFQWPQGRKVVAEVDLSLEPAQVVAIYGRAGAGRSTLAELLLGLRQPTAGQVVVDGVDLRYYRPDRLFADVALARPGEIVWGTVAENLLAGRVEVSPERLEEVLGLVGLREVVLGLPAGLATEVTPRGAPLSRTEQRRLILARALLGEPRLLVVDELFDGATDEELQRLVNALDSVRERTTVVVFTQEDRVSQRFPLRWSMDGGRLARG